MATTPEKKVAAKLRRHLGGGLIKEHQFEWFRGMSASPPIRVVREQVQIFQVPEAVRELTSVNQTVGHTARLLAKHSNGETFIVGGWLEHANAAFAVNPPLVEGSVRIPIHLVKIGVGTLM